MSYNVILYVCAGIVLNSWILPLYSIVTYTAGLKTIDFIVEGIDRSKAVMIVTDHPEHISNALMEEFGCGVTRMNATGGYSQSEKSVIYFVVNRFEIVKTKNIVHDVDPNAYMTITEIADVFKGAN